MRIDLNRRQAQRAPTRKSLVGREVVWQRLEEQTTLAVVDASLLIHLSDFKMTSSMAIDKSKAQKLDVDEYLTTAISATPQELHPFFESFRTLHSRK